LSGIIYEFTQQIVISVRGLSDFEKIDAARVVVVRHDAQNGVSRLRRPAEAIVFELEKLRAAVAEHACDFRRIGIGPDMLSVTLP
jgi:hypothetical protein